MQTILTKLRLLDEQGNLSITNLAMMVLITKIGLANQIDWPTVAGLLMALANYGYKRHVNNAQVTAQTQADEALATKLSDFELKIKQGEEKLQELALALNLKKLK